MDIIEGAEYVGNPPNEMIVFNHPGTSQSRPLYYSKTVVPPEGYYIIDAVYTVLATEREPGCAWCFPSEGDLGIKIYNFGHYLSIQRQCNGLPCKWGVNVYYKEYFIDDDLIELTSDPEDNLQSRYWLENKSGHNKDVTYKLESYNSMGKVDTQFLRFPIPAYSKKPIHSKFFLRDNKLLPYYITLLYHS